MGTWVHGYMGKWYKCRLGSDKCLRTGSGACFIWVHLGRACSHAVFQAHSPPLAGTRHIFPSLRWKIVAKGLGGHTSVCEYGRHILCLLACACPGSRNSLEACLIWLLCAEPGVTLGLSGVIMGNLGPGSSWVTQGSSCVTQGQIPGYPRGTRGSERYI